MMNWKLMCGVGAKTNTGYVVPQRTVCGISYNKEGGNPLMYLSGGIPMGRSLQEKINDYWQTLGDKYGFMSLTVEGSSRGKLFFLAEPTITTTCQ